MATNVIMPALGMAQEKGRLIRWLVAPGATVNKGDPLMEVETDKTTVEIAAPAAGILTQVTAAAGAEVPVTQVVAVIAAPGEVAVTAGAALGPVAATAAPQTPALPPAISPAASPVAGAWPPSTGWTSGSSCRKVPAWRRPMSWLTLRRTQWPQPLLHRNASSPRPKPAGWRPRRGWP